MLGEPAPEARLVETCASSPACAGWYLPLEIDDRTWSPPERAEELRGLLDRTAEALRRLRPGDIAIAPFFTGTLGPDEHARFWGDLLAHRPVDVLMLQDGAGSGYGSFAIPRVGNEVVVSFLDGCRDRPVITGCVHNSVNLPPFRDGDAVRSPVGGVRTQTIRGWTGRNSECR